MTVCKLYSKDIMHIHLTAYLKSMCVYGKNYNAKISATMISFKEATGLSFTCYFTIVPVTNDSSDLSIDNNYINKTENVKIQTKKLQLYGLQNKSNIISI